MIKKTIAIVLLCIATLVSCNKKLETSATLESTSPILDLVQRIAPQHAANFIFKELTDSTNDTFEIESLEGKISIAGNNCNSMAVGLNYYLKKYCNSYVSWNVNDVIVLPKELPIVPEKITKNARVENRFFLNYCTFGYTMPWWQWKDWEHFIDWMALNGVTMPLAITGQEAIWYEVWQDFGLTDDQIRGYFTGPAHLPWHRMSNIDKWGGPLPKSWLEHQKALQQKIVKRERQLGMMPILPAFAGHVPKALKTIFPNAKINKLSSWGDFEEEHHSHFLDPLDSVFKEIQLTFLKKQTEIFGTDHIYGADPFNEVHPPSWEPAYLATVAKTIYTSMKEADPDATWLQMTWIFSFEREHWTNERIEAMITAVPQDKMMLLDYYCEKKEVWKMTDSFFKQPFIWCYLGNFGGNTMLAGNIDEVEERLENAIYNAGNNMQGIGSTLEALDVNPLMYEFVLEKVWESGGTNTNEWIKNWANLRYGKPNNNNQKAWKILHDRIYKYPSKLGQATLTNARPTLEGSGNWTTNPDIEYDNAGLLKAWELMLKSPTETPAYQFDVVNVGRQVLGNHFSILRDEFTKSYKAKNIIELKEKGAEMLHLLDDLNSLLATNTAFLLGKWLEDAKAFGVDKEEEKYYEHNARNIITTWGRKNFSLNDYANRSWEGLTKNYYKKRWALFINDVINAAENNTVFDARAFQEKVTQFEWDWTQGNERYISSPKGSSIVIAQKLIDSYKTEILKSN